LVLSVPSRDRTRRQQVAVFGSILALVLLVAFAFGSAVAVPTSPSALSSGSATTGFSDDFTHDTALNSTLWEVGGPVGLLFGGSNCPSCTNVTLLPSFSLQGMEIAQVAAGAEIGTIQSVPSFAPPFTLTAVVTGIVSNGHPFVFGISSSDASSGIQMTGNLNPNDCSNETNCGNPTTCGNPASPSIAPNQCYYGIYARTSSAGGKWVKSPALDPTPSVDVSYTLQIAVDSSGNAQCNVSQPGTVLGSSTAQVGTGPFYLILAQSEGAPVPGPGPNQAFWSAVSLRPSASISAPAPGPSSSGVSWTDWIILIVIIVAIALIVVVVRANRRGRSSTLPGSLPATSMASGTLGRAPTPAAAPAIPTPSPSPAPPNAPIPSPPPPIPPGGSQELDGFGGERIRQIIRTFQAKGALSPETALTAGELGLSRMFVRILHRRRGRTRVFIEVNGKYYLDQRALQEMK